MRPLHTFILAAGAALLLGLIATPAVADTPPPSAVYGVLDINKAMNESVAGVAMKKEFEEKYKEFSGLASKDFKTLHAAYEALTPADKGKKQQDLKAKVTVAQTRDQERKMIFEHALETATSHLRQEVRHAAAEIARENSIAAVFSSDALVLAEPSMDITAVVTQRVNKKIQKIAVDWSPPKKTK